MSIAAYFYPQQPSIDHDARPYVTYEEVEPGRAFREYIYCYWQLRTTQRLSAPFVYRVVSDGCIDVLFEANNRERTYITGFSKSFLQYDLGSEFNYVGIRFLPTGFPLMFNLSASLFTNQFLELSSYLPEVSERLREASANLDDLMQIQQVWDLCFADILKQGEALLEPDVRVFSAMDQILKAAGCLDIRALDVGLSERQLRRQFNFFYGASPKTFCQVVRFQNILRAKPSTQSLKRNKIFYDMGYYDQAHFIKEFKNFYGVTPSRAFGRQ